MKIRPLYNKVLLKRIEATDTTKGGIIIPDTAKEKPQEALVVAVGKGIPNENGKVLPLTVKKGDRVLFSKYGGTDIDLEDGEYTILEEQDILAIVE